VIGRAGGGKVLGIGVARHAMDGFNGGGYGFGIRLRPAEAAGEPLEKIVNAAGFELIVLGVVSRVLRLLLAVLLLIGFFWMIFLLGGFLMRDKPMIVLRFLRTARIRDFAHGNLMVIVAIVGEFAD
jgi:hypothetical protein